MSIENIILSFDSELASSPAQGLALVGGKGANLARLAQAGLPVPGGFFISTQAYREFVAANGLEACITQALPVDEQPGAEALERASATIRGAFAKGRIPTDLAQAIEQDYLRLGQTVPVAVRSSATAEDLPEMSFAGQQDTFLNVVGSEAVLKAVVDCWSSLWTARAIGYRLRNHVPQAGAALAVVVQQMVESQVSGVLFTANPLTGKRTETVIDATFGLGEALVSGQVEPDHYVVDVARNMILEKTLGAKALSIHGQAGGGTAHMESSRKDQQALGDEQVLTLTQLGQSVADFYGSPQDIEWAYANSQFCLLQSRAVTSLYPVPTGLPKHRLMIFFSFAAVQGLLDPITPLGRDTLQLVFATAARYFGIQVTSRTQTVLYTAGERLWVNITALICNSVGRKIVKEVIGMVEPTIQQTLKGLWDEPGLQPERNGIRPRAMLQLAGFFLPLVGNVIRNLISPTKRRERIVGDAEKVLEMMKTRTDSITGSPRERLSLIAEVLPQLARDYLPPTMIRFVSLVAAGMASLNFVRMLSEGLEGYAYGADWSDRILEVTRGLEHNPTTEMDLDLWQIAKAIQKDPALMAVFQSKDTRLLADDYTAGLLPSNGQALIQKFLERYGGRGLGEIDLGRPRWREDPVHVFEVLSSYIQISQPELAPDVIFAKGEGAAQAAVDEMANAVRKTHRGWLKARLLRFFATRVRELMGARESPKFFAVRMFGILRAPLLSVGADLVKSGELDHPDDFFFLSFDEIKAFAEKEPRDWKALIAARREVNHREALRRQIPRVLLSDGRAFYDGIVSASDNANSLTGSPVSPGRAEGAVRVVLDPRQANLKPGEILVCPGTDPSWTPLFLSAAGLVMEVGGMMTHGAVVAREYGIPAIVGVDQATRRLITGQMIRIDGSSGMIEIIE